MTTQSELVGRLAKKHGLAEDAVQTVLTALQHGGGTMAQFSHPAFGGMAQWSHGGMTMVGDMFNDQMRAKLNALATDLAAEIHTFPDRGVADEGTSYVARGNSSWWPKVLGQPSSAGSQNSLRYAVFPAKRRLAIEDDGQVMLYDTGLHLIRGVSQQQSGNQTLSFDSQEGRVRVSDLPKVEL